MRPLPLGARRTLAKGYEIDLQRPGAVEGPQCADTIAHSGEQHRKLRAGSELVSALQFRRGSEFDPNRPHGFASRQERQRQWRWRVFYRERVARAIELPH